MKVSGPRFLALATVNLILDPLPDLPFADEESVRVNGTPTRWRVTEITADSFRWLGDVLDADGQTWRPEAEFPGRRRR